MKKKSGIVVLILLCAGYSFADEGIATGPELGSRIPHFECADQHGKPRTFEDLRGPEGLLLLFYRTADW